MKKKRTTERYTLADLDHWREATREVKPRIRLGVFGDPVAHSLSPQMHNVALRACKIDMQYARFHIRASELRSALHLLAELDFIGVNLTVPHKITALASVDEMDERAARAGAVNTIRVRDKKLVASNTDGEGFLRAIRSEFSVDLRDLRVMVIVARAVDRAVRLRCNARSKTANALSWSIALSKRQRRWPINYVRSSPDRACWGRLLVWKRFRRMRRRCARNLRMSTWWLMQPRSG